MVPRPRDEWIVVPGAHEPLVSEEDFKKAQLVLQKKKCSEKPEHIFGNKIKCPYCGHAMIHYTRSNPRFKCGTAKLTDHYGCKTYTILQSDIEKVVLAAIRNHVDVLIDHEEMKLAQLQKSKETVSDLAKRIAAEQKSIELLEASVTKVYTSLVSGKITQDAFLRKKEVINDTVARKRSQIEKWDGRLNALTEGRNAAETSIAELVPLKLLETLSRDIVFLLIDRILIHEENDIEIVWNGRYDS